MAQPLKKYPVKGKFYSSNSSSFVKGDIDTELAKIGCYTRPYTTKAKIKYTGAVKDRLPENMYFDIEVKPGLDFEIKIEYGTIKFRIERNEIFTDGKYHITGEYRTNFEGLGGLKDNGKFNLWFCL